VHELTAPRPRRATTDALLSVATRSHRTRRSTLAKAAAGASVLIGAALHPSPAFGHSVYETYTVYDDGSLCTKLQAEIDHGGGNGYVYSQTRAYGYPSPNPLGSDCNTVQSRPGGFIRSRWTLVIRNGPGVLDMQACIGPNFGAPDPYYAYSDHTTYDWGSSYTVPSGPNDHPPCGPGEYSNLAEGGVRYGDSWHSGAAFPGWHTLPAPK
jgi:hypothetical protein